MRTASVLGFLAMVAALLGLFLTGSLFSPSPFVIVAQAGAVVLMISARVTFGRRSFHAAADPTAGGLVTSGPYHYVRHPIYTAVVLFAWAGAFAHLSLVSLALAGLAFAGALARMLTEERLLIARYPEYVGYAARTRRMVPGIF